MRKKMSKKMWGGRFKKKIDKDFEQFSNSIHYDYVLAKYDIYHSIIHVNVLKRAKILTANEARRIVAALKTILKQIEKGTFNPDLSCEDIHTDIQNRVGKKVGRVALKMHSLRSRNDQVVFDEKWYCDTEILAVGEPLTALLYNITCIAEQHWGEAFIGYTHTQRAQIVPFSSYVLAFYSMFERDYTRLMAFYDNLFKYIGAGALAGSSLSREAYNQETKRLLKNMKLKNFRVAENPLDTVSDRDFIVEFLSILSIIQMHLSRMAEDFILYSTQEFDLFNIPEEFCTGSSLMPHKKNPDFLELVRGYTGRIYGNLVSVLTTMKGLPLTYNRDMQLDKEPLFSSIQIIKDELKIMAKLIKGITLNRTGISRTLEDERLYATELAEFLVTEKKVPFAQAHDCVGRLIRYAEDKKVRIKEMQTRLLKTFHPALDTRTVKKIMTPGYAIDSKKSISRRLPKLKK